MSTLDQESRSLREAERFILGIASGGKPLTPITPVREEAKRVLKHYPLAVDSMWEQGRQAMENEYDALFVAEAVLRDWSDHVGTHYEGCWTRHVACLAGVIHDILTREVENRDNGVSRLTW